MGRHRVEDTRYGGQAVIEGVMMRGVSHVALSVRAPGGDILSLMKKAPGLKDKSWFVRLPVIRGAFALWDSLSLGIEMLVKSAEIASPEEAKPTKGANFLSVAFAVVVAVGLFVLLPTFLTPYLLGLVGLGGPVYVSLFETVLRLLILVLYILAISRMKEIQRVLAYHGAEHKVVWAWEKNRVTGQALLEDVRQSGTHLSLGPSPVGEGLLETMSPGFSGIKDFLCRKAAGESRMHPRCGTSFLFLAVMCTWVVFLFVNPEGIVTRAVIRLALLPLVAGLAYEVLRASAGKEGIFWSAIKAPGMALQSLTTREPDSAMLEVAATSLALLLIKERGES